MFKEGETVPYGGMIIVRAKDEAETRARADADPFHTAGLRHYTLTRWMLNEGAMTFTVRYSDQTAGIGRIHSGRGDAIAVRNSYRSGIQRVAKAVWNVEVPMIAAVNGPAYGAGCDLTLFCDIRIASETAVFAENFVNVGIISGDGDAWILPRQVGLSRAAEMAFTADPIDAQTALQWGLVSQVTAPENLMDVALALARRIARNPPRQLRLTKRLMREGTASTLDQVLELSAAYQGAAHQTHDHAEAVAALLERRTEDFSGR